MIKRLRLCLYLLVISLFLFCFLPGCENTITVTWFDADGTQLETLQVSENYDPGARPLPHGNDAWHYTGWTISRSGDVTVCTAVRVAKEKFVWKDSDGTVLAEQFVLKGESPAKRELPSGKPGWTYTKWDETTEDHTTTYIAQREPDASYFAGNVFQIVIADTSGKTLGTGSGYVFQKDGWFITNNHVMKGCYSAQAYFDIPDAEAGSRYTVLPILGGAYHDEDKDFFIGKLDGYEKIAHRFQNIPFTQQYAQGDVCYSMGYPNSSVTMEINKGTIKEEYSNIYDKIKGKYYVLSDCYIAPGSSGGILVNQAFEVIGITTIGLYADSSKKVYSSGGSIPTYMFIQHTKELNASDIRPLWKIYAVKS